jgi:galactokinase
LTDQPDFAALFSRPPEAEASAPGRVNLIGEHTDYNDGFVLPIAIPQRTVVSVAARGDQDVRAWSANVSGPDRELAFGLGMERPRAAWIDYVQAVTVALARAGCALGGFDARVESTVPLGAGLSSSASLEVALIRALARRFDLALDAVRIARIAHAAETQFVGVPVGMMDQMAASLASTDAALFIDTRSLAFESVPIPASTELLVIDSGQKHEHAGGEYRQRRQECADAAHALGVSSLRDVTLDQLRNPRLPEPLERRARHVVTENARVLDMRQALLSGDIARAGALMNSSHASMRDDFAVSTPQIDLLAGIAQATAGVAGARLTGGGFGGCIVALVERGRAAAAGTTIADRYSTQSGCDGRVLVPEPYPSA